MGRPRNADTDEATRARVLEAAAEAFAAVGQAARLEDIAKAAGIRRSSLLHHFASKDALYAAVIDGAFCELERNLRKVMIAGDDFEARLKAVVGALIAFETEQRALLAVVMRSLLDQEQAGRRILDQSFIPLIDRLEAFVHAGTASTLPKAFPLRAAILQLVVAHMVRSAMGDAGQVLWQGPAHTWKLTQAVLQGAAVKPKARAKHG